MNVWKPIALLSTVVSVFAVAQSSAIADSSNTNKANGAVVPQDSQQIAQGSQPHMQAALAALRTARAELAKAEHDKGGWRAAAQSATGTAITETERGIQFDNTH